MTYRRIKIGHHPMRVPGHQSCRLTLSIASDTVTEGIQFAVMPDWIDRWARRFVRWLPVRTLRWLDQRRLSLLEGLIVERIIINGYDQIVMPTPIQALAIARIGPYAVRAGEAIYVHIRNRSRSAEVVVCLLGISNQ